MHVHGFSTSAVTNSKLLVRWPYASCVLKAHVTAGSQEHSANQLQHVAGKAMLENSKESDYGGVIGRPRIQTMASHCYATQPLKHALAHIWSIFWLSAGRPTFLELLLDKLQLVGSIALLPVVSSRASLLWEVNAASTVGLSFLAVGAVVCIPLGNHGVV